MQQLEAGEAPVEDAALLWRRSVYSRDLWALPVATPGPFAAGEPRSECIQLGNYVSKSQKFCIINWSAWPYSSIIMRCM